VPIAEMLSARSASSLRAFMGCDRAACSRFRSLLDGLSHMAFFRDLLHAASMSREARQDGARLFGAAEHLGKQLKIQLDMAKERVAGGRCHIHPARSVTATAGAMKA
jgi:hypothetical protein